MIGNEGFQRAGQTLERLVYISRSYSWLADPRAYLGSSDIVIDRPIFLLGTQGGGLTLVSRILRRHASVVSAAGNNRYWTSADEMQNVFGLRLPAELTGLRYKAPSHSYLTAPRSWTYAARDLYPQYRNTHKDARVEFAEVLEKTIKYCGRRYAADPTSWRFVDKSQVFTVKVGLIYELLKRSLPRFILVVRDPYTAVFRAATGGAADMARLADRLDITERLDICAEHYANSVRAVLEDSEALQLDIPIIRFEDLLARPKQIAEEICRHVELELDDDMLPQPHHRIPFGSGRKDRWYPIRSGANRRYEEGMRPDVRYAVDKHFEGLLPLIGYK